VSDWRLSESASGMYPTYINSQTGGNLQIRPLPTSISPLDQVWVPAEPTWIEDIEPDQSLPDKDEKAA